MGGLRVAAALTRIEFVASCVCLLVIVGGGGHRGYGGFWRTTCRPARPRIVGQRSTAGVDRAVTKLVEDMPER